MTIAQNLKLNQPEIKIVRVLKQEIFNSFKFRMTFEEINE